MSETYHSARNPRARRELATNQLNRRIGTLRARFVRAREAWLHAAEIGVDPRMLRDYRLAAREAELALHAVEVAR